MQETTLKEIFESLADLVANRVGERITERPSVPTRLLDVKGAATFLGQTPSAVRHLVNKRLLPVVRIGDRIFFDTQDLEAKIAEWKQV